MDATSCGCLNSSGPPVPIASITAGSFSSPSTWDCNCVPQPTNNVFISSLMVLFSKLLWAKTPHKRQAKYLMDKKPLFYAIAVSKVTGTLAKTRMIIFVLF